MYAFIRFFLVIVLFSACAAPKQQVYDVDPEICSLKLCSINIKDRGGLTETISNPERLQQYENINFLESQPYTKVLRVFSRDMCGNVFAVLTTYHENGLPYQYLEIVNNRAFGAYKEWFANGKLKLETKIISGNADVLPHAQVTWLFDGMSKVWNEDGCLAAEIPYSKGKLEGCSKYYYPNGNIWKNAPFEKGELEGTYTTYYENGEIAQISNYCSGLNHGELIRYWCGGKVASKESYNKGLLLEGSYFNSAGEEIAKIEDGNGYRAEFGNEDLNELQQYQEGVLTGEVKVFNDTGQVARIYHIKNGQKNGPETFYYMSKRNDLKPKLLVQWVDGKIHGMVKTWYTDGSLESHREMSDNKKNGLYTAWYKDGSVMIIEEYEKDRLVKGEYFRSGEVVPISQVLDGKGLATFYDSDGRFLKKIDYSGGKPLD